MVANNNPLNLRPVGAKQGFRQFASIDQGLAAGRDDIMAKVSGNSRAMAGKYGENYTPTLTTVLNTYAPPTENDTQNYINFVAKQTGIDPNAPLTPADVDKVLPAMAKMESGYDMPADDWEDVPLTAEADDWEDVPLTADTMAGGESDTTLGSAPMTDPLPEPAGFAERVGDDLSKRWKRGQESAAKFNEGKINAAQMMLRATGNVVAGGINDVVGNAMESAWNYTPEMVKEPLREGAAMAVDAVKSGASSVAKNMLGEPMTQFVKDTVGTTAQAVQNDPELMEDLSAAGNIAMAVPSSKATGAGVGTPMRRIGDVVTEGAERRIASRTDDFLLDLVRPKSTPKVRAEQFGRSTREGLPLLKKNVIIPSKSELAIAKDVAETGVKEGADLLDNYNRIKAANEAMAEKLVADLSKQKVIFPRKEINAKLNQAVDNLAQNPFITGNAEATAEKIVGQFNKIMARNESSPAGLLKARKELDQWIRAQRGKVAFEADKENAITAATREIRQAANQFIADKVPDVAVKESLAKQTNLWTAMDNIAEKGGAQLVKPSKREVIEKNLLRLGTLGAVGGTAALTSLGTAAGIGAGLGGAYLGGKALASPITQKAVGKALKGAGRALGGSPRKLTDKIPKGK